MPPPWRSDERSTAETAASVSERAGPAETVTTLDADQDAPRASDENPPTPEVDTGQPQTPAEVFFWKMVPA